MVTVLLQIDMMGLLEIALFGLMLLVSMVTTLPIREKRDTKVFEFFMTKTNYDKINWYGADAALNEIREDGERHFGKNLDLCPSTVKTGAGLPVSARSTCPWYYEINHKPNRYPANLLIAKTPCVYCIGTNDTDSFQCNPVTRTIEILNEKEEASGAVRYETEEIEIPVGFTCGGRRLAENAATTTTPTANEPPFARRK